MQILRSKLMDFKCCRRCCSITFSITSMLLKCFLFTGTCTNCNCTFQALPSIAKEVIEVLDILLRWFVLQFCKSNTTCLLKVSIIFVFVVMPVSFFSSFSLQMYGVSCNFIQFNCSGAGISSRAA